MNIETMKKQISEMDVKSDEFFELYKQMNKNYWSFNDPDCWQQACQLINTWLMHGKEEEHMVVASVIKEVFEMRHNKRKACTGTIVFTDETFHFDIYTSEVEKDNMASLISDAQSKMKKGHYEFKDKHGKRYFKKK